MHSCSLRRVTLLSIAFAVAAARTEDAFPPELVRFVELPGNPVFTGSGPGHWDAKIRERGWILKEGDRYHMWYTGYSGDRAGPMRLGYATSADGLRWQRHPANPLLPETWIEDMMVVRDGNRYLMVAEGRGDIAHLLTSSDGVAWKPQGPLDVRTTLGKPLPAGPYGTPVLFRDECKLKAAGDAGRSAAGRWLLFYERQDLGIWVAASTDLKVWINLSDEPVLRCGPEAYDRHAVALNQIVEWKGRCYAYYHSSNSSQKGRTWTSCVAVSDDLIAWKKYAANPILADNKSSPILVPNGNRFRLYTMHDQVRAHECQRSSDN